MCYLPDFVFKCLHSRTWYGGIFRIIVILAAFVLKMFLRLVTADFCQFFSKGGSWCGDWRFQKSFFAARVVASYCLLQEI